MFCCYSFRNLREFNNLFYQNVPGIWEWIWKLSSRSLTLHSWKVIQCSIRQHETFCENVFSFLLHRRYIVLQQITFPIIGLCIVFVHSVLHSGDSFPVFLLFRNETSFCKWTRVCIRKHIYIYFSSWIV